MRLISVLVIILLFSSCKEVQNNTESTNNKNEEPNIQNQDLKKSKLDSIEFSKGNFKVVKIDSVMGFYLVYAKKNDSYYKIISEKIYNNDECRKITYGEYIGLELNSIVPDTSKLSYKVDGILYKGHEFDFERDSIIDLYETSQLVGLCYKDSIN